MMPATATRRLSDRYAVLERIGRGGVGEVYRGWQAALDRPVAIKVLRPELTRNLTAMTRFEREARTACRLMHPNVVTVFDVGESDDGGRFLVMELLDGTTLADRMAADGALPLLDALEIARQIVRGMGAGQGVGLVHRDLKPENIFITVDGTVKILDFGLATLRDAAGVPQPRPDHPAPRVPVGLDARETFTLDGDPTPSSGTPAARLTNPGTVMGTPRYVAPEQALAWDADHRSDLYSFGCILFEMLAGRSPFEGPDASDFIHQHIHAAPLRLRDVAPAVPRPLARVVERLLAKSPSSRYADWAAVAEALRQVEAATDAMSPVQLQRPADEQRPTEPYRFLHPFTPASRAIFFGRDTDARAFRKVWESPERPRVVMLTGASGVGKTSFIGARIVPGLQDTGHHVLRVRGGAAPLQALAAMVSRELRRGDEADVAERSLPELLDRMQERARAPLAVVLDQVEEVFTSGHDADAASFQAELAAVVASGDDRVRFVLALREDYLGTLVRRLYPLPIDELARTVALRPLESGDLLAALVGPGVEGLPVAYRPFRFEHGLPEEIVADLLSDCSGEVAPRVQAVGARLWEMVRGTERPIVTRAHYRTRLGGARGILARVLDEAIDDLDPRDRGLAKELLRALTHLPGSPTSRPAPSSELCGHAADQDRRADILLRLENRWRVVQGYADPRWPAERTFRIAHEALVARIQQYGEEGTERNRARQLFHHGLSLWLQGGRTDNDLMPERHFDEVQRHIEDLVLRTPEERAFYEACSRVHNEGWMRRHVEARRDRTRRRLLLTLAPMALLGVGFLIGQAPVGFATLRVTQVRLASALSVSKASFVGADLVGAELVGVRLREADLSRADLRTARLKRADLMGAQLVQARLEGADLSGADLQLADLTGAGLWGTRLARADLRGATVDAWRDGADFTGARFNLQTKWGSGEKPLGAFGPGGRAEGIQARDLSLSEADLTGLSATGAVLTGARLDGAVLDHAQLDRAALDDADLRRARLLAASLSDASLSGADLTGADLSGTTLARADLRGASLLGASLVTARRLDEATLTGAIADGATGWPPDFDAAAAGVVSLLPDGAAAGLALDGANLRGLSAPGIDLSGAHLRGATLQEADLSRANLRGAVLIGADLTGANLRGADLCGADFTDAVLTLASLTGAVDCDATRWPLGAPAPLRGD